MLSESQSVSKCYKMHWRTNANDGYKFETYISIYLVDMFWVLSYTLHLLQDNLFCELQ